MPKSVDLAKKIIVNPKVKRFIDLNTDLGQGRDQAFFAKTDYELLNSVTSVSVPCAVHDGDPRQLLEVIRKAKEFNCVIGAHIGYPDPARYGYEPMQLSEEDLSAWIYVQYGAFRSLLGTEGLEIEHVRPHGALYTAFVNNPDVAMTVARALHKMNPWALLIAPAGPLLERIEQEVGLRTAPEFYLGKRYNEEGQLTVHRIQEFLPPQGVMDQAKQLLSQSSVTTEDGRTVPLKAKTIHVSPLLPNPLECAEKLSQLLVQPMSLPLADIGASGWL